MDISRGVRECLWCEVTLDDIARALASYERTQFSFDSPFDHYVAGESGAIDESAKRGWKIFDGSGRCISCHVWTRESPLFNDGRFHKWRISRRRARAQSGRDECRSRRPTQLDRLATDSGMSDLGRYLVTHKPADIGASARLICANRPYATCFSRRLGRDAVGGRRAFQSGRRAESVRRSRDSSA